MSTHLLYRISVYIFEIGWLAFAAIFVFRRRFSRDKTKKADRASITGIALQGLALAFVWVFPRRDMLIGPWLQPLVLATEIVLVVASFWIMAAAMRVLGKQWSLQARVLEDHKLIREGPYRFVRHPIYTGMLGMIVVAGLAWSHWIGFIISILFFAIGTAIRVRSEEKLLREQFGGAFDDYKRRVPAVVPIKF
ncbi:MAG TPA: isoprenylcysteine carboxylmethyltransferase family protein [Chthoniobacterales bacterium]|nr:isoprenylcysteine carboxylmethyltransferase family protein [Chthoniobacterales bacterium]